MTVLSIFMNIYEQRSILLVKLKDMDVGGSLLLRVRYRSAG